MKGIAVALFLALITVVVALVINANQTATAKDIAEASAAIERASSRLTGCDLILAMGRDPGQTEQGAELLAQARLDFNEGRYDEAKERATEAYFKLPDCPRAGVDGDTLPDL